ncbi:restriction endonuclease subunit S [Neisseria sicca]
MATEQQLPKGWKKYNLFDICQPKQWKTIAVKDLKNEGYPVYGANGIIGFHNEFNHEKETLLIGCRGSCGEVHISQPKSYINGNAMCLDKLSDNISLYYLYYFLKGYNFKPIISGSTQPQITQIGLRKVEIPIPPLETQQAIVNKIESLFDEIDEGIGRLKTAAQQIQQYRQSLLKNAFNGELTKEWRSKHADTLPSENELLAQIQTTREQHHAQQLAGWQTAVSQWEQNGKEGKKPSKPKASTQAVKFEENFADLPRGWFNFSLDTLAEISGGLTKNAKRGSFKEKVPYLRVANVYANELKLDEIATIGIQENEKARTLLQTNDLLIVEGNGSIEQIGRVAIWNNTINPCYHQNHLIKARCYPFVLPKFALYFLISPMGRERIINVASSTTGLHTLSLTKVANLIIPVCSLAEQTQIVAILETKLTACDQLAPELAKQLKQAELLKQAVLKAAFSGSLLDK